MADTISETHSKSMNDLALEECDLGHKFYKLPDHPKNAMGYDRCPYCMATGLDAARIEVKCRNNVIDNQFKSIGLYQEDTREVVDMLESIEELFDEIFMDDPSPHPDAAAIEGNMLTLRSRLAKKVHTPEDE